MPQVHLNDRLYMDAKRRAAEAGFSTVDEFVSDFLSQHLNEDSENLDHLFTPQVISELDRISAEIKAGGKTYTMDQVEEHFRKKREQWLQTHRG